MRFNWFNRILESTLGDRSKIESVHSKVVQKSDSIDGLICNAREVLLREGPTKALEYIRESNHASSEPVVRMMHALVWNHRRDIPAQLLAEPFLDPIWCQCTICDFIWLISPLLSSDEPIKHLQNIGLKCSSCGRVFCPQCAVAADVNCQCGGVFSNICHPNGRKRREWETTDRSEEWDLLPPRPEIPTESLKDVHLYFGFEGRVPVGIDISFPSIQKAGTNDHLNWAETLIEAGLYYQAQQQLDLLSEPGVSYAKANWLRARIELVRLHNAAERHRRKLDMYRDINWREWPDKIKSWLDVAVQQSSEFGPAWLTAAQVYLDPICGQDFSRGLHCAQQAKKYLGETPAVLLALGQALRGTGRPAEAAAILCQIPAEAEEIILAKSELKLAELETRCQSEPVDVEAHLMLGRWCFRHSQRNRAEEVFARILDRCPDCAEGYYGLAQLAFTDFERTINERSINAYKLCHKALTRNPDLGIAHELMGTIFYNLHFSKEEVDIPMQEPLDCYRRAIELDSTCDIALLSVAEDYIHRGQLQPAIELLERAAALDSTLASVYDHLAVIYKVRRQFENEDQARRKAKELSPDTELSSDYENKILELCGFEY